MENGEKFYFKGQIWTIKRSIQSFINYKLETSYSVVDQEGNFDEFQEVNLISDPTFKPFFPGRKKQDILNSIDHSLMEILKILREQVNSKQGEKK